MELLIYRNQLKLEIDTETRKAGFFHVNPENQEAVNEAQLGTEFSDRSYFERKCQQGIDALLDILHKFVVSCNEEERELDSADNKLEDTKVWKLELTFDGRRNIITRSLASVCHKYVAYNMLYSWAVMTMPNLVGEYKEQRQQTLLDIQRIVYRKESPVLEEDGSETNEEGTSYKDMVDTLKEEVASLKSQLLMLTQSVVYYVCESADDDPIKVVGTGNNGHYQGASQKVKMVNATTVTAKYSLNGVPHGLYYKGKPAKADNSWQAGEVLEIWCDGRYAYAKPWYEE